MRPFLPSFIPLTLFGLTNLSQYNISRCDFINIQLHGDAFATKTVGESSW
jgi:hypothetical protein